VRYIAAVNALQASFRRDGVVLLPGALDATARSIVTAAYGWSLAHPGPHAGDVLKGTPGTFYQDHANPRCRGAYGEVLFATAIPDLVAEVLDTPELWLLYEQIWLKEGAATRRTPWHQDLAYVPLEGEDVAVLWTPLDPVDTDSALEFVRGSHSGPLYNPTAFDPDDPAAAMFEPGAWPRLPDVDAGRERWPIVSWPTEPGDLLIFHPGILHGGAPTRAGQRRRSLSLRFFGERAWCAARPEGGLSEIDRLDFDDGSDDPISVMARSAPGTPFRHPGFMKLRPR
jgi:Phytanoyl-CoA dioxygenase (PhyH)